MYDVPRRLIIKFIEKVVLIEGNKIWVLLEPLDYVGLFTPLIIVGCSMHIVYQNDLIYWYDVPK